MKPTKEEISLCKQVAERHRKDIEYGDWFEFKGDILLQKSMHRPEMSDRCTPLWTISDCLKFLREEGFMVRLIEYEHYRTGIKRIECNCYGHKTKRAFSEQGDKDEEAYLKAVLVVLEEK